MLSHVTMAADEAMQWELFEVLAERLALTTDMQPGNVMALDMDALICPDALLGSTLARCGASRN